MQNRIYLSPPHMGNQEKELLVQAFDSNWIAPLGPFVDQFEQRISQFLGENVHTAALSSGTGALHLALQILGVGAGDHVICQSFTFCASVNPVKYLGAIPVFVDSEEDTWNISPQLLEKTIVKLIEQKKKPKAVIAVHLYGMPAKIKEIANICKKYEVPLIEDAAEALGSTVDGQKLGTFGEFGILSFNGNKIITTSGGGALVSKDGKLIEKSRFLATQAREKAAHYEHKEIGYNYRLSNLCAAIGCGQMQVLPERISKRREVYQQYEKAFSGIEGMTFLNEPKGYFSNRWLSCVLIDPKKFGCDREAIRLLLEKSNIESRPLWKPMHLQPIYKDCQAEVSGVSEKLFTFGLCLPSGSSMTAEQQKQVIQLVMAARG